MSIRLKITYDNDEIWIRGDEEGLKYLAECCTKIIGNKDPSGHWHLQSEMNNLMDGSIKTRIEYTENPE